MSVQKAGRRRGLVVEKRAGKPVFAVRSAEFEPLSVYPIAVGEQWLLGNDLAELLTRAGREFEVEVDEIDIEVVGWRLGGG